MDHKFIAAKRFFSEIKKTANLYKNVWKDSTTALLHAPREVDKTATALSIASDVAQTGREVLYINAENRLGDHAADCDNLYIFTPEFDSIDDNRDYADLVFEAIEHAVRTSAIRTFVVDSVTRIASLSFGRNASAAYIMKRLVALQVKCKLSLLIVADDTTRSSNRALLSLASSEIAETSDQSDTDGVAVVSKPAPTVATRPSYPKQPVAPLPLPVITRQQRRALARQQAKNDKHRRDLLYALSYNSDSCSHT